MVNCRRSRAITADSVAEVDGAWEHQKEPAGVQNADVYACMYKFRPFMGD